MNTSKHILPAVAAIVFNEKGEVLLQRRRDVDQWCVISGNVEFGETVEEAIIREIEEETGLSAQVKRFIGVYSAPPYQTYSYKDKVVQYVTCYFEAELNTHGVDTYSNNETKELKFFPIDQVPAEMAMINPYWLKDALDITGVPYLR